MRACCRKPNAQLAAISTPSPDLTARKTDMFVHGPGDRTLWARHSNRCLEAEVLAGAQRLMKLAITASTHLLPSIVLHSLDLASVFIPSELQRS